MPYVHVFEAIAHTASVWVAGGGYVALFLLTFLEGIPLIGVLVPGHVAIIAAGFFAKIGALNLYWVLAISLAGAIFGDFLGFAIGRTFGMAFIDRLRPYFFVKDGAVDKAHALLAKHTGKAMVIGRFNPITRALLPFLVGTTRTPAKRFWLFNLLGGIAWTVASVGLGYVFGSGVHAAVGYLGKLAVVAILAGLIIIWGYRFVNVRFHIFKRYELFVLILNVLSLFALARSIEDAFSKHSFMANFDVAVNLYMHTLGLLHPMLISIALSVTNAGDPAVLTGLGILIGLIYLIRFRFRRAAIMLLAIGVTSFLTGVMKEFFFRARPLNALQILTDNPSFPSGHAATAAAFFLIISYLAVRRLDSWVVREIIIVFCVLATIAIGLSRLVLNVHWASDVIAGWALGIFLASASILLVRYVGVLVVRKS